MDSEVTSIEMKPASQGVTNLGYRSTEVRTALHVISNKRPTGFNGHMGEHSSRWTCHGVLLCLHLKLHFGVLPQIRYLSDCVPRF